MSAAGSTSLEITIHPASTRFAAEDDGWRRQVIALYEALRDDAAPVRRETRPTPGRKAGGEVIIAALGTSGAIAAAVQVFNAWLSRARDRSITVTVDDGGKVTTVAVDGTNVDVASLETALNMAFRRLTK
jgi:hypothetical protein